MSRSNTCSPSAWGLAVLFKPLLRPCCSCSAHVSGAALCFLCKRCVSRGPRVYSSIRLYGSHMSSLVSLTKKEGQGPGFAHATHLEMNALPYRCASNRVLYAPGSVSVLTPGTYVLSSVSSPRRVTDVISVWWAWDTFWMKEEMGGMTFTFLVWG